MSPTTGTVPANANGRTEAWLSTVLREARLRQCLILHGNVRDVFWCEGASNYVQLPDILLSRLQPLGFTLCARWDCADGFAFPDPVDRRAFVRALDTSPTANPAPAKREQQQDYDLGSSAGPCSSSASAGQCPGRLYAAPQEAFAAMRRILANPRERPAFVLDLSDWLLGNPAHLDPQERQLLTVLGRALGEGAGSRGGGHDMSLPTGITVLLTCNPGAIPPSLYQGDSKVKLLPVPVPDIAQRRCFFTRRRMDLRVGSGGGPAYSQQGPDQVIEQMAVLTDALRTTDLVNLLALSQQSERPARPEQLVNLYKFGDQRSPWEDIDRHRVAEVEDALRRRVLGQEEAVEAVATVIRRAFLGLAGLQHSSRKAKPKGVFFFAGPSGVGKTEMAKAIAEFLFGDESACARFDMSEYSEQHTDQRLVGSPPGYVGFEEGGQLTNAVRQRPFCVLLFDEIEKAHGRILDKFLQILEDGRLTDGRGETVYFSEALIVFTSNIGSADLPAASDAEGAREHFLHAVRAYFNQKLGRPELLNRVGHNIIPFVPVTDRDVRKRILSLKLKTVEDHFRERYQVPLRVEDAVLTWLEQRSPASDHGRGLVNVIERDLINRLPDYLFAHEHQLKPGRTLVVNMDGDDLRLEIEEGNTHAPK